MQQSMLRLIRKSLRTAMEYDPSNRRPRREAPLTDATAEDYEAHPKIIRMPSRQAFFRMPQSLYAKCYAHWHHNLRPETR